MKKFIITLLILLTIYIGCVVWITWGVKLEPLDKILICIMAAIPYGISYMIALGNDWLV